MRQRIGELWIGLGAFHLALIGVLEHANLARIVRAGFVGGLGDSADRAAAFWLLYLGAPFFVVGVLARWAQRRTGTVPESLGWVTILTGIPGAIVVPVSGFWLYLGLGVYTVLVARRDRAPVPALPVSAGADPVSAGPDPAAPGRRPAV